MRVRWILLAVLVAACQSAPVVTPGPAPAQVQMMVVWLREHTLACAGPTDAGNDRSQWSCQQDQGAAGGLDKTVYRGLLTTDASGLVELSAEVDQSANDEVDLQKAQGFLADTIGSAPAIGPVGSQIGPWVDQHIRNGGAATFGGVHVTLTPFGRSTQLRLTFTG